MITVDSNIWAYYFDETAKEHNSVKPHLRKTIKKENILINTVIQMEVAHYLIKVLGPILGKEKIDVFLSYPLKVDELTRESITKSIELLQRYTQMGIGGRDATILQTMKKYDVTRLMTHDNALKRVDWLDLFDPCEI